MKPFLKSLLVFAAVVVAVGPLGPLGAAAANAATSDGTVSIAQNFHWGTGNRDCVNPPADYVVCVFASAAVPGLGTLDFARYAENAPGMTKDGCGRLSTHGTIWVEGGTAEFDGPPASTCGKGTGMGRPDAHYLYTIVKGTGVLVGATGSGDIVADHGVDIWKGTLFAPKLKGMTVPLAAQAPADSTVTASTGESPSGPSSSNPASPSAAATGAAASPSASIAPAAETSNTSSSTPSGAVFAVVGLVAVLLVGVGLVAARRRASVARNS